MRIQTSKFQGDGKEMFKKVPSSTAADQKRAKEGSQSALRRLNLASRHFLSAFIQSIGQSNTSPTLEHIKRPNEQSDERRSSLISQPSESPPPSRKSLAVDCCLSLIGSHKVTRENEIKLPDSSSRKSRSRSRKTDTRSSRILEANIQDQDNNSKPRSSIDAKFEPQASFELHPIDSSIGSMINKQNLCNERSAFIAAQSSSLIFGFRSHQFDDNSAFSSSSMTKNKSTSSKRQNSDRLCQLMELLDRIGDRNRQPKATNTAQDLSGDSSKSPREDPFQLEENWTKFVSLPSELNWSASCEALSSSQLDLSPTGCERMKQRISNLKTQQDAIWELVKTELFYIKGLKAIIDVFMATLMELQQNSFLLEIEAHRLMSNIEDIYLANTWFWLNHLHPMLARSRLTHCPMDPSLIRQAFVQLRQIFNPYYRYCLELTDCLSYLKEQSRANEHFRVYVAWCESRKDCDRLKLMDLLAKPTQRITRYSLLLKAIAKRSDCPDHQTALDEMIAQTDRFVLTVDLELRRRDDMKRLLEVNSLIESFDCGLCDSYNNEEIEQLVRMYNRPIDLTEPIFNCPFQCHRQLIFDSSSLFDLHLSSQPHSASHQTSPRPELTKRLSPGRQDNKNLGQFRFRDAQSSSKFDVVLLLFTDQLLICRQVITSSNSSSHQNSTKGTDLEHPQIASGSLGKLTNHAQCFSYPHQRFMPITPNLSSLTSFQGRARTNSAGQRIMRPQQHQELRHQQQQLEQMAQNQSAASLSARALSLILAPSGINLNDEIFAKSVQIELKGKPERQTTTSIHSSISSISAREAFIHSAHSKSGENSNSNSFNRSICDPPLQFPTVDSNHTFSSGQPTSLFGIPTKIKSFKLRVIRPPYPIDRLEMFELKDGKSVFCCLLSDSKSILNSFVIYLSSGTFAPTQSHEPQPIISIKRQPTGGDLFEPLGPTIQLTGAGSSQPSDQSSLKVRQSPKRQPSIQNTTTPAKQLISLIRETQLRLKLAADFHSASVVNSVYCPTGDRRPLLTSTGSHDQEPEPADARMRHHRWSFSGGFGLRSRKNPSILQSPAHMRLDPRHSKIHRKVGGLAGRHEALESSVGSISHLRQFSGKLLSPKMGESLSVETQEDQTQQTQTSGHTVLSHLERSLIDQYRFMLWSHAHFDKLVGDEECLNYLEYLLRVDESLPPQSNVSEPPCTPRSRPFDATDCSDIARGSNTLRRFLSPKSRLSFRQAYGSTRPKRLDRKGLLAASASNRTTGTSSSAGSTDESWLIASERNHPMSSSSKPNQSSQTMTVLSCSPRSSILSSTSVNTRQTLANSRPLSRSAIHLQQNQAQGQHQTHRQSMRPASRRHLSSLKRQNVILMQSASDQSQQNGSKACEDANHAEPTSQGTENTSSMTPIRRQFAVKSIQISLERQQKTNENLDQDKANSKSFELGGLASGETICELRPAQKSSKMSPGGLVAVTLTRPTQDESKEFALDQQDIDSEDANGQYLSIPTDNEHSPVD